MFKKLHFWSGKASLSSIRSLKVTFLRPSLNAQPANFGPYHKNDHIPCLSMLLHKNKSFLYKLLSKQIAIGPTLIAHYYLPLLGSSCLISFDWLVCRTNEIAIRLMFKKVQRYYSGAAHIRGIILANGGIEKVKIYTSAYLK